MARRPPAAHRRARNRLERAGRRRAAGGSGGYVADATAADGAPAIIKLAIPEGLEGQGEFAREVHTLHLGAGRGYVDVLRADLDRRAMLQARLGRPLDALELFSGSADRRDRADTRDRLAPRPRRGRVAHWCRTGALAERVHPGHLGEPGPTRRAGHDRPGTPIRAHAPRCVRPRYRGAHPRRCPSRQRSRRSEATRRVQAHRSRRHAVGAGARPRDPLTRLDRRAARRRPGRARSRVVCATRSAHRRRPAPRSGNGPSSSACRPASSCFASAIPSAPASSPSPISGRRCRRSRGAG